MRSLDKMLYMVYTGHRNPERDKQHNFISEKRQLSFVKIYQARKAKLKARLADAGIVTP